MNPISLAIRRLICRVFDHDLVHDDWATPETGGMAAYCKRCDWGFSTTLY